MSVKGKADMKIDWADPIADVIGKKSTDMVEENVVATKFVQIRFKLPHADQMNLEPYGNVAKLIDLYCLQLDEVAKDKSPRMVPCAKEAGNSLVSAEDESAMEVVFSATPFEGQFRHTRGKQQQPVHALQPEI